jgi:hypothetical protein
MVKVLISSTVYHTYTCIHYVCCDSLTLSEYTNYDVHDNVDTTPKHMCVGSVNDGDR